MKKEKSKNKISEVSEHGCSPTDKKKRLHDISNHTTTALLDGLFAEYEKIGLTVDELATFCDKNVLRFRDMTERFLEQKILILERKKKKRNKDAEV